MSWKVTAKSFLRTLPEIADKFEDEKEYEISLAPFVKKRSLDANAYAWVLIGKIADALGAAKEEVYLRLLKLYGQGGVIKVRDSDKDAILRSVKYYEPFEQMASENANYYRVWVGSSAYNTAEMSAFIDGAVLEAKEMKIETLTPDKIAELKAAWKGNE